MDDTFCEFNEFGEFRENMMKRPLITLNMASSIDGKITTARRDKFGLGSEEDRAMMETLRAKVDAVLIGKGTLIDEDPPLLLRQSELIAQRKESKKNAHPINMVAASSLNFNIEDSAFFNHPQTEKIVFTTTNNDPQQMKTLETYATVIATPTNSEGRVDLVKMVRRMPELNIHHLLLEGGGELNFAMLEAGLIDEIYLTLCPMVIGGSTAPTTFEGEGFRREMIRHLTLKSYRVNQHGEIFLQYHT